MKLLRNVQRAIIRNYVTKENILKTNKPERMVRKRFDAENHPEFVEIIHSFYQSKTLPPTNFFIEDSIKKRNHVDKYGLITDLPKFIKKNYSKSSILKIGNYYLKLLYAIENLIFQKNERVKGLAIESAVKVLSSSSSWKSPTELHFHIGKAITSNDLPRVHNLLKLPSDLTISHNFIQNFNSLIPQFNCDLVDDSYFTNSPDNIYELPKLSPIIEFNPLFLSNKNDFMKSYSILFDDDPNPLLIDHLNRLFAFGKYSYLFYSSVLNIDLTVENKRILILNSLIFKSVKNKNYQDYLINSIENDDFTQRVFYQYLGLASLKRFPIEWLQSFSDGFELKKIPNEIPTNKLIMGSKVPYRLQYQLNDPKVNPKIIQEVGALTLRHVIQSILIQNNDKISRYPEIRQKILDLIGENDALLLLGNLAWNNLDEFGEYIKRFFVNINPSIEIETEAFIKSLISRYYTIPLPIIKPLHQESKVSLPAIPNSTVNRFYMLNPSILSEDESQSGWRSNPDIRTLLFSQKDLGKSKFFFGTEYYLRKLNLATSNEIKRLFGLSHFRRLLIDETNFFYDQTELRDYLLNPSIFKTTITQLWLYISLLSTNDIEYWMKKVLYNINFVSEHLEDEQFENSIETFTKFSIQEINSKPTALGEINKSIVLPMLQKRFRDIMNNIEKKVRLRRLKTRPTYVEILGKSFVKYVIMKSNLGVNYGESIILNANIIDTFDSIFPNKFYQLIGRGLLQDVNCEDIVMEIINDINSLRYIRPFKIDVSIDAELNIQQMPDKFEIGYMKNLTLPIGKINDLTKLSLIPYLNMDQFVDTFSKCTSEELTPFKRLLLRDKLFQIRHFGNQFHEVLVLKNLAHASHKITDDSLNNLYETLVLRFFKVMATIQSPILMFPFEGKDFISHREKIIEKYTSQVGIALSFYEELYDQYMGNLAYQDAKDAEEWMKNVISPILKALMELDPHDQDRTIDRIYNDLCSCPLKPDNMPKIGFRLAENDPKYRYRKADFL